MMYEAFEKWIENLVIDLGYTNVERDVVLDKELGGQRTRYQIDVVYGRFWNKRFVECKYLTNGNVSLEKVSKFHSVLELLGIDSKKGVVVTNRDFVPRALHYGVNNGLELIDREELIRLDKQRTSLVKRLKGEYDADLEHKIGRLS